MVCSPISSHHGSPNSYTPVRLSISPLMPNLDSPYSGSLQAPLLSHCAGCSVQRDVGCTLPVSGGLPPPSSPAPWCWKRCSSCFLCYKDAAPCFSPLICNTPPPSCYSLLMRNNSYPHSGDLVLHVWSFQRGSHWKICLNSGRWSEYGMVGSFFYKLK